ncbi:hypothetical protein KSS87_021124 [Heliosperma pusillum]|nr:hypothetical protein KSS87_021124 [Heliosperma pusillum]
MSWLRTAVNKAVEVGNKNNITRTVKNYADSVVLQAGQAVAEGAKLLQDRIVPRNHKSFKHAVKRLEEASVSCRGPERVQLLRRWFNLLKEIERISGNTSEEHVMTLEQHLDSDEVKENTRKPSLEVILLRTCFYFEYHNLLFYVLFYDSDDQSEPMNFRDVFLHSQALEGITLSMLEHEVSYSSLHMGLCLTGGKEVHHALVSSIQDLAQVFSSYEDEVLGKTVYCVLCYFDPSLLAILGLLMSDTILKDMVKREELLQFAQGAISGLKISAELLRVDNKASSLKKKLDDIRISLGHSGDSSEKSEIEYKDETIEGLKQALAEIRICSTLEGLLLKKQSLYSGDTPDVHAQKIDKLKVLSESLANSAAKSEKRISDTRIQREEALNFRVSKESEVSEMEKEIGAEVAALEKQRDELEAQLKKVNISLTASRKRLQIAREEKDQFDEANNQILEHLKTKEEELSRSIDSCKAEADVLKTWINFLEDTWAIQCTYMESKEKQAKDELEVHEDFFVNLAIELLSGYKKELEPCIGRIEKYVKNLKALSRGDGSEVGSHGENEELSNPRRTLEEEYLDYEAKIVTTFSVVDNIKEHMYSKQGKFSRKDDSKARELIDDIEKLRVEFDSIERPTLEMEFPSKEPETRVSEKPQEIIPSSPAKSIQSSKPDEEPIESSSAKQEQVLDHEAELAKLESEFGNLGHNYTSEEIGGWEFDELEKELAEK